MSSMAAKVESAAKELGFKFAGYDGSGHIVWQHPNGARYSTPATPSEYRGVANSIAALERLSGRKIDRPNHRREPDVPVPASPPDQTTTRMERAPGR